MCSSPEGYGSISSTYVLLRRAPRRARGSGCGRPARPPRPAATCARCLGSYRRSFASPGTKKPLVREAGEAVAALRRGRFLRYARSCCTDVQQIARHVGSLFPETGVVERGELRARRARRARRSPSASARRSSSTARRRCANGRGVPRRRAGGDRRLRDEGVPERRGDAPARRGGPRRRRVDARRAGFAREAGLDGERLVVHGNNKSDEELRAAGRGRRARRARRARRGRARGRGRRPHACSSASRRGSRPTRTSRSAPATTARSSASPPDDALEALDGRARAGLEVAGLHVHVGSQLVDAARTLMAVDWLADVRRPLPRRARLGARARRPRRRVRRRHVADEPERRVAAFCGSIAARSRAPGRRTGCPRRSSSSSRAARSSARRA